MDFDPIEFAYQVEKNKCILIDLTGFINPLLFFQEERLKNLSHKYWEDEVLPEDIEYIFGGKWESYTVENNEKDIIYFRDTLRDRKISIEFFINI